MTVSGFRIFSKNLFAAAFCVGFTACQEPQPKPDIPSVPANTLHIETLSENLKTPWSVAELPDVQVELGKRNEDQANLPAGNLPRITIHGGYLITERSGALKWRSFAGQVKDITGLPEDIYVEGQAGLFDVVLAPDFYASQELFISYAYGDAANNGTALVSAKLINGILTETKTLFKTSPFKDTSSHFGGRIAFMNDGTLLLSTGEGFAYREEAQNLGSHFGKIIRLNRDGSIVADNPFSSGQGGQPEIYSYGHRNPQGLAIDPKTGTIWETEHGPRGGDELNIIKAGNNYGWPLASTGVDYNGARITPFETKDGTHAFVKDWVPSIAPSGLTIYRGDMFPGWNGDAFVGGLAAKDLRRVDLENGRVVGEQSLLSDLGGRVRDVRTARDGSLLVLIEDAENGKLLRITPATQ